MQNLPADISASQYPFSDAEVKIRRARKHFAELETEICAFAESRPATFDVRITEWTGGPQRVEIDFHLGRLPPAEIGAIVGDIIHSLRSALNLMACDLVRLIEPGADVSNVYFPFCNHVDDLDKMIRRRNFHRAGPQAVALLLELKPYRGGNVF